MTLIVPDSAMPHIQRHRNCFKQGATAQDSIRADFKQLLPYLPKTVGTILDIGCGMAGIDVLLKRHYPDAQLWLLDGDGKDPRDGWEKKRPEAFSSRAAADELLAANGVKADRWIDINTPEHLRADLVISLASWGYHYPIATYNVTGYCIADLRLSEEKPRGKVIQAYPKRARCAWTQKGKP